MEIIYSNRQGKCARCGIFSSLEEHHIYRRTNNKTETVFICRNCHRWIHDHIAQAREEGFYKPFDAVYRKKKSNPSKWIIKK